MIGSLQLPFRFDADLLRHDLAVAAECGWLPHHNEQECRGQWKSIALWSASRSSGDVVGSSGFTETPVLASYPRIAEIPGVFPCQLKSVRLLSLEPGSFIRGQSDFGPGFDDGKISIHIPIQTNPEVEFYLNGERLLLREGHCYFLNVSLPHRVNNHGARDLVHLVIDAEVNDWIRDLFRRGTEERSWVERSSLAPRNVNEFRQFVLRNPELQKELQAIPEDCAFFNRCVALGRDHGFDFQGGDLDVALKCAPVAAASAPAGWTPVRFSVHTGNPTIEWVHTGDLGFTEPFLQGSIRNALRSPFARMFRIEAPWREVEPDVRGVVFHVTRCGSTLVSRMLTAAGLRSISEAHIIDQILQADAPEATRVQWLRGAVAALGNGPVYIKLDASHNRSHTMIRAAFPETPWVFLYRDPVEVLVSQLAKPGRLSLTVPFEEFCRRGLEEIYASGLEVANDPRCISIDYRDLPGAVLDTIASHFGIRLDSDRTIRMGDAARFDAKTPAISFQPDSDRKQASSSADLRRLCDVSLAPIYRELRKRGSA